MLHANFLFFLYGEFRRTIIRIRNVNFILTATVKLTSVSPYKINSVNKLIHLHRGILFAGSVHGMAMGTAWPHHMWTFSWENWNRSSCVLRRIKVLLIWWKYRVHRQYFCCMDTRWACLQLFMHKLNHFHDTVKFMANWSAEEVVFLDTRVCLRNGFVETDLHIKPTDTHQYLWTDSCHLRPGLEQL